MRGAFVAGIGVGVRFGYAWRLAAGAIMHVRVAIIIGGLVAAGAAGAPALAKDAHVRKPAVTAAARGAVHRIAVKRPAAGKSRLATLPPAAAPAAEPAGHGRYRKGGTATQKRNKDKDTDILAAPDRDPAAVVNFPAEAVDWRLIEDSVSGARLGLPEKLVPRGGVSRTGSRWASAQGQIQIETFRLTEAALPALFEEEKKAAHRQITSSVLKPDSFVIVGVQGLKNFVVRADAHGSEVRGVTVLYDQATEGIMDRVASAVAASFAGFPDPNAAPLPGLRRTVEYGTAIAVTNDGDLIAPARLTDECQAITVPGLGHAERVAADPANNLALIRLYGARNVIPAALGGDNSDSSQGNDLTLVGVVDPLAQGGAGAVSRAAASRTAQGITPPPKPGFSGAAALDARGRFAGVVSVNPSIVAGSGGAGQAASLVPAEAIRAFLQEHHITPATAPASANALEQSVVRVICVRK
jgi:hypothetical protein